MVRPFGDYALKYFESDIFVIPINAAKEPSIGNGFKKTAQHRIYVESWAKNFPHKNIASLLGMGKMKDIVAFDIDIADEGWKNSSAAENMQKASVCLPYSPVFKKGKKGVTIFYRCYFSIQKHKDLFDFITNGYTILPPSLYYDKEQNFENTPEFNYVWGPESLLTFDPQELPILEKQHVLNFIEEFGHFASQSGVSKVVESDSIGRDNKLAEIAFAMACRGEKADAIAEELLRFDLAEHSQHKDGPFCNDQNEPKVRNKKPYQVALRFAQLAIEAAMKKGAITINQTNEATPAANLLSPTDGAYFFEKKENQLPQLPKFLLELAIYLGHGTKSYNGSVIFALFVLVQIFGKRIEFYNSKDELRTALNLYFLYVCPSGIGKGRLKNRMLRFLKDIKELLHNTRKVSAPKSDAAIFKMFKKPVVAIIQEEFHKILAASKNQNSPFNGINETLGDIFGEGAGEILEKDAADDSYSAAGVVEPFLSILGMTQPRSFKSKVLGKDSDEIFHQGLGARLIFAVDADKSLDLIDKDKYSLLSTYLKKEIEYRIGFVRKEQLTGDVPKITLGSNVLELIRALSEEYDQEYQLEDERSNGESLWLPVINRRLECSLKIAVIYAICEIPSRGQLIFEASDLLGAIELVRYFEGQLDELIFGEKVSDDAKRVLDRIVSAGENGITERDIYRKNHQEQKVVQKYLVEFLAKKLIFAANRKEKSGPAKTVYISIHHQLQG